MFGAFAVISFAIILKGEYKAGCFTLIAFMIVCGG